MYASIDEMIVRFGERELIELTDRADPPAGMIDEDVLNSAIQDGTAHIDSALSTAGYITPLLPTPNLVIAIACDIARYKLYVKLAMASEKSQKHIVEKRYDIALKLLAQIADGTFKLPNLSTTDNARAGIGIGPKRATFGHAFDRMYGGKTWA